MLALIDGDLIVYEAAFAASMTDDGSVRDFEYVSNYIDRIIEFITTRVGAKDYNLYLTGKDNFRFDIATIKPYKGNRKEQDKPFHYENARQYLVFKHYAEIIDNMEADDKLAIEAVKYKADEVCICSRDKDLRQVPCWQFSWEVGKQPEWGPTLVSEIGELTATFVTVTSKITGKESEKMKKLSGTGLQWFYAQCIIGDSTDNIPGLEGKGMTLAYELLRDTQSEEQMFGVVLGAYVEKYAEDASERLLEQGRLLWMCREEVDGQATMWELPCYE